MTPAPISVERLREVVAIVNGPLLSCKANDHAAWEAVSFLQDQGLALLQQLAELKRELSQSRDFNAELNLLLDTAKHERDVAERARDEATGLLREAYDTVVLDRPVTPQPINLAGRIAAFLAASGGDRHA